MLRGGVEDDYPSLSLPSEEEMKIYEEQQWDDEIFCSKVTFLPDFTTMKLIAYTFKLINHSMRKH